MSRVFDEATIREVLRAWLLCRHVADHIDRFRATDGSRGPRFTADEAGDFARYVLHALSGAPTHGLPKMPYNLILTLGIEHDGVNPGATIEVIDHRFGPQLVKWDCHRKLGPSVMFRVVEDAIMRAGQLGRIDYVLHNAAHFGYGRLYGEILADAGLISEIRNTAGRGNEVFPLGADTTEAGNARMGTNPLTLTIPLGSAGATHFSVDAATTPLSFGTMAFRRLTGEPLPAGCAVDDNGQPTTDAKAGRRLVHSDRLGYGLGLAMEGLAAIIGGGPPQERCARCDDRPGGSSDWIVTVMTPEYLACVDGDPIARVSERLRGIVAGNGSARLPGGGRPRVWSDGEPRTLDGAVLEAFLRMAREAEVQL